MEPEQNTEIQPEERAEATRRPRLNPGQIGSGLFGVVSMMAALGGMSQFGLGGYPSERQIRNDPDRRKTEGDTQAILEAQRRRYKKLMFRLRQDPSGKRQVLDVAPQNMTELRVGELILAGDICNLGGRLYRTDQDVKIAGIMFAGSEVTEEVTWYREPGNANDQTV